MANPAAMHAVGDAHEIASSELGVAPLGLGTV
jgi:hypothetical protein